MAGIDYLDFEVEVAPGADGTYRVRVLRSPTRIADAEMTLPFERGSLDAQLRAVQARLLLGNPSSGRAQSPAPAAVPATDSDVRLLGEQLFDALFRDGVRAELAASQKAAEDRHRGLRIKLQLRAPELAALPWELLFDPGRGDYLALAASTPLVRFVPPVDPPAPLRVRPPLRILGMVASPVGLRQLHVERERQRLELALEGLRGRGGVELEWLGGQSARFLQAALRQGPWHILHFIGHGGFDPRRGEGFLVLAGDEGEPQVLDATNLARLVADHDPLRMVVLNACDGARGNEVDLFSSTAALVVQKGTPAVVGMQFEITDEAAIEFSRSFYEAIADGAAIDTALGEARKGMAVNLAGTLEWATPVLYTHAANGVLFTVSRPRRRATATPAFDGRPVLLFDADDEPVATMLAAALERQALPTVASPRKGAASKVLDAAACILLQGPASKPVWSEPEVHDALAVRAHDPRFPIAPVLLPGSALPDLGRLPDFLAGREWIDLRAGVDVGMRLDRLVEVLALVEALPAKAVVPSDVAPFRGLEVFDEQHADVFFGREALTQQLIEHLRSDRFLAVVGPSGSGKSSVVRAGLIAEIRRGALPDSAAWPVVVMKPGSHPLDTLAGRLAALSTTEPTDEQRETALANLLQGSSGLGGAVTEALASAPADRRVLIVVDQFEEVFTLAHDQAERERFVTSLIEASRAPDGRTVVVITMRADFIGHAAAIPVLASTLAEHDVLVSPMTREELRRAIVEPATRAGLQYEAGVVDTIMAEVGGESGALPLLEDMLLELWEGRSGGWLTMAQYREIGGVRGAIAKRADATYEALSDSQQPIARRILLRLVSLGSGSAVTKRRAALSDLQAGAEDPAAPDVDAVLGALVAARLITTAHEDGKDVVDVAHEALISNWPRLRGWIEDSRAALRVHRRIADASAEWDAGSRDPSYLLRGSRLTEAASFEEQYPRELNELERTFVTASVDARRLEEDDRRRSFRRRLVVAGVGVVAVLGFAVASGKFLSDTGHAQEETRRFGKIADARAANATGVAMSATDPAAGLGRALDGWVMARQLGIPSNEFRTSVEGMLASGRVARVANDARRLFSSPDGRFVVLDAAAGPGSLVRVRDGAAIETLGDDLVSVDFGPPGSGVAHVRHADGTNELRLLETGALVPLPAMPADVAFPLDDSGGVVIVSYGWPDEPGLVTSDPGSSPDPEPSAEPEPRPAEVRSMIDGSLVRQLDMPAERARILSGGVAGRALVTGPGGRHELLRMTDGSLVRTIQAGDVKVPWLGPATVIVASSDGEGGFARCAMLRTSDGAVLSEWRPDPTSSLPRHCYLWSTSADGSVAGFSLDRESFVIDVATAQVLAQIRPAAYVMVAPGREHGYLVIRNDRVEVWAPGERQPRNTHPIELGRGFRPDRHVSFSADGEYGFVLYDSWQRLVEMATGDEIDIGFDVAVEGRDVEQVEFAVGPNGAIAYVVRGSGNNDVVLLNERTMATKASDRDRLKLEFWPASEPGSLAIATGATPDSWSALGVNAFDPGTAFEDVLFSPGSDPQAGVIVFGPQDELGLDEARPSILISRDGAPLADLSGQVTSATFGPYGATSMLVAGYVNGTSEIWDRASGTMIGSIGANVAAAVFDGTGERVLVRYGDGGAWLIDVARLRQLPRDLLGASDETIHEAACDALGDRAVELAPVACAPQLP